MLVSGTIRKEGEDCKELVSKFLTKVMGIQQTVQITKAFRVGGPRSTMILFYLARSTLKGLLFKYIGKLTGKVNVNGEYFNLRENLTGAEKEKYRRAREAIFENRSLQFEDRMQLKIKHGQLQVDGHPHTPAIDSLKAETILDWDFTKWQLAKQNYEQRTTTGEAIQIEGSSFQGYSAEFEMLKELKLIYDSVKAMNMDAKHVVCAFHLPGRNFVHLQDGCDDGEHGAARILLNAMKLVNMFHRVIIVVRRYDGVHIGVWHFEGYLLAARSVVLMNPVLAKKDIVHKVWSEEYCHFQSPQIDEQGEKTDGAPTVHYSDRGRASNFRCRGYRGHGRSFLQQYWERGGRGQGQGWGARGHGARGGLPHIADLEKLTHQERVEAIGEEAAKSWVSIVETDITQFDKDGFPILGNELQHREENGT